jgi:tRNA modification GTPase
VVLADTAGLRESGDAIEQEGVRRARARAAAADLRVLVLDACGDWRSEMQAITDSTERWNRARDIVVANKADLVAIDDPGVVALSTRSGTGLPWLLARLETSAEALMQEGAGAPPLTRARHREALLECQASLERALHAPEVALAAEDLRLALRAIGRITGTVRLDELLDVIFRDFCIGK